VRRLWLPSDYEVANPGTIKSDNRRPRVPNRATSWRRDRYLPAGRTRRFARGVQARARMAWRWRPITTGDRARAEVLVDGRRASFDSTPRDVRGSGAARNGMLGVLAANAGRRARGASANHPARARPTAWRLNVRLVYACFDCDYPRQFAILLASTLGAGGAPQDDKNRSRSHRTQEDARPARQKRPKEYRVFFKRPRGTPIEILVGDSNSRWTSANSTSRRCT